MQKQFLHHCNVSKGLATPTKKSDGFATALIVTWQHNYRNVFVNMIVRCFQRKQSKKFNLKFLFGDLSCQDYAALM